MSENIKKGSVAEDAAASHLQDKGYEIVERNFRHGRHEIDMIAKRGDWLVFVEVKMRSSTFFGNPEIAVNRGKRRNLRQAARWYIFDRNWEGNIRFDVISITVRDGDTDFFHIEDAFG